MWQRHYGQRVRYEYSDGRPVRAVFRASKFNKRGPHAAAAVRFGGPGHVATVASRDGTLVRAFMRNAKLLLSSGQQVYKCVKCSTAYNAARRRRRDGGQCATVAINERTREVFCIGGDALGPAIHHAECSGVGGGDGEQAPTVDDVHLHPMGDGDDNEPPWLGDRDEAELDVETCDDPLAGPGSDNARSPRRYELPDGRPVCASFRFYKREKREKAEEAAMRTVPPGRRDVAALQSGDGRFTCNFMRMDSRLDGTRHVYLCTKCKVQYKTAGSSGRRAFASIDWQSGEVYCRGGDPFAPPLHHRNCNMVREQVLPAVAKAERLAARQPEFERPAAARLRPYVAGGERSPPPRDWPAIKVVTPLQRRKAAVVAANGMGGSGAPMSPPGAGLEPPALLTIGASLLTTERRCVKAKPARPESNLSPETPLPAARPPVDEAKLQRLHSADSLLSAFRRTCAPPLSAAAHKRAGVHWGRVAVVGGSEEYCGAPYFAGITALKCGAELAHVLCPPSAAPAIQSYSPDLDVDPILPDNTWPDNDEWRSQLDDCFGRVDAIALGPGLGRSEQAAEVVAVVSELARRRQLPIVLDADALWYVGQSPGTVRGNEQATLTPNVVELVRLLAAVAERECTVAELTASTQRRNELAQLLASQLGGCTVVAKGHTDYATDGTYSLECSVEGSVRRCGGQGDMLAGALALFQAWTDKRPADVAHASPSTVAAFAASALVRRCARVAFERRRRSTVTGDMVAALPAVVTQLIDGTMICIE